MNNKLQYEKRYYYRINQRYFENGNNVWMDANQSCLKPFIMLLLNCFSAIANINEINTTNKTITFLSTTIIKCSDICLFTYS